MKSKSPQGVRATQVSMLPATSAQASVSNAMYMQSERISDAAVALIQHLLLLCRDTMSRSCAELLNGQMISS